jgi:hypothetical protein
LNSRAVALAGLLPRQMPSTQSIWSKIMKKIILLCASLFTMGLLFSAGPARAQSVLWVSATGNDASACSQTAPCASFQGAINKGNVAQINCLTSGSYGPAVITASITIDCGAGNIGEITSTVTVNNNGAAIFINTSSAATVVLRHLSIYNSLGSPFDTGIDASSFFSSGTLIIEDCMVHGFHNIAAGINFGPRSGRGLLQVSNSQIFDNDIGIQIAPGQGLIASVTLNQVELVANSSIGLNLVGNGVVAGTMRSTVVGENGTSGVVAQSGQVFFTIEESSIVDNLVNGIHTNSAGSSVKVGASTIGGNGTGVLASSGSIVSFGNNQISDNGSDGNFTSTKALT